MPALVDQIVQILKERPYSPDLQNILTQAMHLFEKSLAMRPIGWSEEVLQTQMTPDATAALRRALVSFVERTGHGSWALSHCGDQTDLKGVYIGVMRRQIGADVDELYHAMMALENLGEPIFPADSGSIDDPKNRLIAAKYLATQKWA